MTLLHHLVDAAAQRWPDRVAVSDGTRTLTYQQLARASRGTAGQLAARGVRRGERVAVAHPSTVDIPVLVYAASRIGAVFCVLHELTRGGPLAHVLTDAEPALFIGDDPQSLELARAHGVPAVSMAEAVPWGAAGDPLAAAAVPARTLEGPIPVDPMCLIYTSGTTTRPKAVVSTHQHALFAVQAIQSQLNYRADDLVYCPLPLSFDYGMYQLFLAAVSGATVRLAGGTDAGPRLLYGLAKTGATVLAAVPSVAETLARLLRHRPTELPSLRLLTNTGAAMAPDLLARLRAAIPSLRIQLMFGLTECKRATIMPPDGDLVRPGSCGLPLPGTEVFAIDPQGRRLPAGATGELVVRGPNVMPGYWRRPELTAQRFPRAHDLFPELRTGDHGWLDEDGYVYFVGRVDDIYKERGFRVSATEVEAAARRVPGVEQAAVLPPGDGRPAILATVTDLAPEEVLRRMRDEIEEFKIPRRCLVVPALPLTRNGKVDRKALLAEVGVG